DVMAVLASRFDPEASRRQASSQARWIGPWSRSTSSAGSPSFVSRDIRLRRFDRNLAGRLARYDSQVPVSVRNGESPLVQIPVDHPAAVARSDHAPPVTESPA